MSTQIRNAKAAMKGAVIITTPMQEWLKQQGAGNLLDELSAYKATYQQNQKTSHPINYETRSLEELAKLKAKYQNLLRRIAMAEAAGIASEV